MASKALQNFRAFLFSRRGLAVAKGTLAYLIALTLVVVNDFDKLLSFPQTMTSMMLVIVAGQPGKSVGLTIVTSMTAAAGVLVGCLNFVVLAKLSHAAVGQAFYYAFVVYVLAYLKARMPQLFAFSLLGILMSFNGVYTGYLLGKVFNHNFLFSYLEAYMFGIAIVLFVNLFVFPVTAERELKELIVGSLEHIETFGMLVSKSYLMKITPEERALRDSLAQSVRADFGRMSAKLAETSFEVNWSKWSMDDYKFFVGKIRGIQQALISTHSSIRVLEAEADELYKETFVPRSMKSYNRVILDLRVTLQEIREVFGAPHKPLPTCFWETAMDMERAATNVERHAFDGKSPSPESGTAGQLEEVSRRLAAEFQDIETSEEEEGVEGATYTGGTSTPVQTTTQIPLVKHSQTGYVSKVSDSEDPEKKKYKVVMEKPAAPKKKTPSPEAMAERGAKALAADYAAYSNLQYDLINAALTSGALLAGSDATQLRVHTRQPSVYEAYGNDYIRGTLDADHTIDLSPLVPPNTVPSRSKANPMARLRPDSARDSGLFSDDSSWQEGQEPIEETENHSLVAVYSMLFSLGQYVKELGDFHDRATSQKKKGLHFHLFESFGSHEKADETELELGEALAMLESKPYTRKRKTFGDRVHQLRVLATDEKSMFALKSAAAATTFAMFAYVEHTRTWFVEYSLSSGLLTIVVALSPTLGQSAFVFILQIAGSSIGYLLGLAVLSIFNNVGGYKYNPYGCVSLITLFSLPLQYVMYEYPKLFPFALLSLNGAGVMIITEWVYRVHDHDAKFDDPAYRVAKALTSTAMAVGICAIFQLFILRNPARRMLRKAIAKVTYSNLAYLTMLQAFVRAVVPADPKHQVPPQAVARVHKELVTRELKIQSEIIQMMPLIMFSSAEPSLSKPFDPTLSLRLIRVNQFILDRMREARSAIGTTRLDEVILRNFVTVLSPHRRRSTKAAKNILGMCASSLATKTPLPQDMPFLGRKKAIADFVHDALVLSHRFAQTDEGQMAVRTGDVTRYWFYVLSLHSIFPQLDELEDTLETMYGRLEDSLDSLT